MVVYKGTDRVGEGYCEFDPEFKMYPERVKSEQARVVGQESWEELFNHVVTLENDMLFNTAEKMKFRNVRNGKLVYGNYYLRKSDLELKKECLIKSSGCAVCGFDTKEKYGKDFEGLMEVHLVKEYDEKNLTAEDLVSVCPDCHRALHSKPDGGFYEIDGLRKIMARKQ